MNTHTLIADTSNVLNVILLCHGISYCAHKIIQGSDTRDSVADGAP